MSIKRITSRTNPLMAHIRKLCTDRRYRRQKREFVCEGSKLLKEALLHDAPISKLFLTDGMPLVAGLSPGVDVIYLSEPLMASLSTEETPQGVLFLCPMTEPVPAQPLPPGGYLVLDRLQDPGNVGTLLRTALAFGARGVFLLPGCADPYNPKTVRAGMGAVFRPLFYEIEGAALRDLLTRAGISLYAALPNEDAKDLRTVDLRNAAVVLGNEGQGISKEIRSLCDDTVYIPMEPGCESLNAAAAGTVVLWNMYGRYPEG